MRAEDVLWGLKVGVFFACFYTVVALAIFFIDGDAPFQAHGVGLTGVVLLYFGSGVAAGTVVGALRRFIRGRASAMAVGVLAAVPIAFGVYFFLSGPIAQWDSREWIALPIFAIVLGAGGGSLLWSMRDV